MYMIYKVKETQLFDKMEIYCFKEIEIAKREDYMNAWGNLYTF